MSNENSEFEISGIQLRESRTQPRVSLSREIGEAQIVHTIFGKAKVRIIRKHDNIRRALWWTGLAAVAVIAGVAWLGWFAPQQAEPLQSAGALPAASPEVQSSVAATQTQDILLSAASSPAGNVLNVPAEPAFQTIPQRLISQQANEIRAAEKAAAMPPVEQNKPVPARRRPAVVDPSTPTALKPEPDAGSPKPAIAKPKPPVVQQPGMEGKQPAMPLAGANNAVKNQTDMPLPAKPKQPVVPANATARVMQPAASSPAAAVPLASPLTKDNAAPQSPTNEKPLSDPVNTSGK